MQLLNPLISQAGMLSTLDSRLDRYLLLTEVSHLVERQCIIETTGYLVLFTTKKLEFTESGLGAVAVSSVNRVNPQN